MANVPRGCAACIHQRRSCNGTCILSPYFPIEKMEDFLNVRALYGISRFVKIIHSVPSSERSKTAETIILEARTRKLDPAHGSLALANKIDEKKNLIKGLIQVLQKDTHFIKNASEIENEIADLEAVLDSDSLDFVSPTVEEEDAGSSQSTQPAGENSNSAK